MNKALLRAIVDQIRLDPASLFMGIYIIDKDQAHQLCVTLGRPQPLDGKLACIYGWGLILTGRKLPEQPTPMDVGTLFEITVDQALKLAYPWNWPEPFLAQYAEGNATNDVEGVAQTAVARIEHLLATGE